MPRPHANMKLGPRLQLFYEEQIAYAKRQLEELRAEVTETRRVLEIANSDLYRVREQFAAALDDLARAQGELTDAEEDH